MRGPTRPVCRKGESCTAPAAGAQLVFTRGGQVAARVVVATNGSYSVALAPGDYTVSAEAQTMVGRGIEPSTVHVAAGQARVDFHIDTGIR